MTKAMQHESKTKLLNAALNAIRAKGYAATTIDDSCHAAGVTKGSFFYHFRTKDDLALTAAAHWSEMTERFFAEATYRRLSNPLDRLLGYVDFRISILRGDLTDYTCFLGTLLQETYATHPDIREACERGLATHNDTLAAISKLRRVFMRRMRPGAPKASACSSNRSCKARSFSPRLSKVPKSLGRASRICGVISNCCSTRRKAPNQRKPHESERKVF
jgi:AcrR family transcriptional regulator